MKKLILRKVNRRQQKHELSPSMQRVKILLCEFTQYTGECKVNPLYLGNPKMSTFANSEDPDQMPHDAAFHQGLHCL